MKRLAITLLLLSPLLAYAQFPTAVDSAHVITEAFETDNGLVEKAIDELGLWDQLKVALKLLNPLYGLIVLITYYFICTKVTFIPTNAVYKRNIVMFVLSVIYAVLGYYYLHIPILNLFLSGLCVNALWEYGVKWVFRFAETRGWIKHSEKYISEIIGEKEQDIKAVQSTHK